MIYRYPGGTPCYGMEPCTCPYCSSESTEVRYYPRVTSERVVRTKVPPPPGATDKEVYTERTETTELFEGGEGFLVCSDCGGVWQSRPEEGPGDSPARTWHDVHPDVLAEYATKWQEVASTPGGVVNAPPTLPDEHDKKPAGCATAALSLIVHLLGAAVRR